MYKLGTVDIVITGTAKTSLRELRRHSKPQTDLNINIPRQPQD